MERRRVLRIAVGCGEIDGDGQTDLAASKNVVEECMALGDLELGEVQFVIALQRPLLLVNDDVLTLAFLEHGKGEGHLANVAVFA